MLQTKATAQYPRMPKNVRRRNFRMLSYVAFGLITLPVLAIGQTIWGLREDAIQEAATNTGNIAVVLSEQLARSIQSVDIVLTDVRNGQRRKQRQRRKNSISIQEVVIYLRS